MFLWIQEAQKNGFLERVVQDVLVKTSTTPVNQKVLSCLVKAATSKSIVKFDFGEDLIAVGNLSVKGEFGYATSRAGASPKPYDGVFGLSNEIQKVPRKVLVHYCNSLEPIGFLECFQWI